MEARQKINFDDVRDEVLVLLYQCFIEDGAGFSISEMSEVISRPKNAIRLIVKELIGENFVSIDYGGPENPIKMITGLLGEGALYVSPDDRMVSLTRNGVEYIDCSHGENYEKILDRVRSKESQEKHIPASDRYVTLSHNSPERDEVVAALDKVIREFREDHRYDNELGKEKGALLKALEAGRELLDDAKIKVSLGVALLIEPLKNIVEKYEKDITGSVIKEGVGALAKYLLDHLPKILGL